MDSILSPERVNTIAFDGKAATEAIPQHAICAAERDFLLPVVGRKLYDELVRGRYAAFVEEFIVEPVALYVRYRTEPKMLITVRGDYICQPSGENFSPTGSAAQRHAAKALLREAQTLLREASRFLDTHAALFPEYEPERNVHNRTATDGGIIQVY